MKNLFSNSNLKKKKTQPTKNQNPRKKHEAKPPCCSLTDSSAQILRRHRANLVLEWIFTRCKTRGYSNNPSHKKQAESNPATARGTELTVKSAEFSVMGQLQDPALLVWQIPDNFYNPGKA